MSNDTNIPTPRTDAARICTSLFNVVHFDIARQLERELAEAKAENAELRKDRELLDKVSSVIGWKPEVVLHRVNCHEALLEALSNITEQYVFYAGEGNDNVKLARAALELAKGGGT